MGLGNRVACYKYEGCGNGWCSSQEYFRQIQGTGAVLDGFEWGEDVWGKSGLSVIR